jgi:hypothetical protein
MKDSEKTRSCVCDSELECQWGRRGPGCHYYQWQCVAVDPCQWKFGRTLPVAEPTGTEISTSVEHRADDASSWARCQPQSGPP